MQTIYPPTDELHSPLNLHSSTQRENARLQRKFQFFAMEASQSSKDIKNPVDTPKVKP